ncbi:MAG: RibD C-terminal domain, partial [Gaiellaceae bacterium]|nr:RibD C-terminal domain [Gaiellaceae bacterium]
PTLATAFFEAGLVDKLLLFIAPVLIGEGPRFVGPSVEPLELSNFAIRSVGEDTLVEAYVPSSLP